MPYLKGMAQPGASVSQNELSIISMIVETNQTQRLNGRRGERKGKKGFSEGEPSENPAHPMPRHRCYRGSISSTSRFEFVENAVVIVVSIFVVVKSVVVVVELTGLRVTVVLLEPVE